MQRGDGRAIAFDGVPFLDGKLPTSATVCIITVPEHHDVFNLFATLPVLAPSYSEC